MNIICPWSATPILVFDGCDVSYGGGGGGVDDGGVGGLMRNKISWK